MFYAHYTLFLFVVTLIILIFEKIDLWMDHEKELRWQLLDSLLSQGKPLSQDQIFRAYAKAGIKQKATSGYLPSFRKDIDHFKKVLRDADKEGMLVVGRGAYSKVNKSGQDCRTRTYYYKEKGFTLRHLLFSDEMTEAEYLQLLNAISKLSDLLSPNVFEELSFVIQSRVEADYDKGMACVEYEDNRRLTGREYRPLFYQAIKNKQILHVYYKNYKGVAFDFDFHPYLLKQYNERWFVFGLRPDKHNPFTNVPLDRITMTPRVVGTYSEDRPASYANYFKNIVGVTKQPGASDEDVQHIKIRISDIETWGRVTTKPLPTQQVLDHFNSIKGFGRIIVDVIPNEEFFSKVLSWGRFVTIEEPLGIQEIMVDILNSNLSLYKKDLSDSHNNVQLADRVRGIYEAVNEPLEITEEYVKKAETLSFIKCQNLNDYFIALSALNLLNSAIKKSPWKKHLSYSYIKGRAASIFQSLILSPVDGIEIGIDEGEDVAYFKVRDVVFSFHHIPKSKSILHYMKTKNNSNIIWPGIRLQTIPVELFNLALSGDPTKIKKTLLYGKT